MTRDITRQELAHARSEMDQAERALDLALSLIEVAPRADKVAISAAVEQAIERLRTARSELSSIEASLPESA